MADPRAAFRSLRDGRRWTMPWARPNPKRWVARPFPRARLWEPWSAVYELHSPSMWWKDAIAKEDRHV